MKNDISWREPNLDCNMHKVFIKLSIDLHKANVFTDLKLV